MTAPRTANLRVVLLVIVTCLLAAAAFAAVAVGRQYQADRSFHPIKIPSATAAPSDLAPVLSTGAPTVPSTPAGTAPTAAGIKAALASGLTSAQLGPALSAQVIDLASGSTLFSQRPNAAVAPASTSKLLTAAAILTVHKPTDRFTTKVVAGASPGTVVLVGGGDPTLSGAPAGTAVEYPEAARVSDLAAQVRRAVGSTPITQVVVDDSLFTGSSTAPGWDPGDAPSSYASPITATMIDAGREVPNSPDRTGTPDLAAGNALATALAGATVSLGSAPAGAKVLGQVSSAPIGVLVEQMLRDSDNVIAEVLGRQVALAQHQPGSFAAGAASIASVLTPLGIDVGTGMKDSSGLSGLDRITASSLGAVLVKAASTPGLRSILTGLSVAGWDGSLVEQGRFTGNAAVANGALRAKTGSLTGVSALAGYVTDQAGRQLIFAFVADQAPSEAGTRDAIDDLAAALVSCGCH